MPDAWIKGAVNLVDDRIAYADANGLSRRVGATYRVPGAPWRKVWHTMEAPEDDPDTRADEGWELDQARSYIIRHRTPPHLWALPEHDVVFQTVPLNLSAYALLHETGDPETNHVHAIQTEVIGFAKDGLDDPDLCDWLGRRVLGPVIAAGVPISPFIVAPSTGSDGYGTNGRVRMSWAQWANFGGQCGHANVPGNQHWDPGVADYLRIARAASQEEDMPLTADDLKKVRLTVREELDYQAKLVFGISSFESYLEALLSAARKDTPAVDPAKVAVAVVAALPQGSVDAAVVTEAVKAALREGTA